MDKTSSGARHPVGRVPGAGAIPALYAARPALPGLMIADPHPVYREGLAQCLQQAFGEEWVIRCVSTLEEASGAMAQGERRWVVLLDLPLHRESDVAFLQQLRDMSTVDHVVVLSGLDIDTWLPRVREAGASLFISKNDTSESICAQLRQLLQRDGTPVPMAESATDVRLTARQAQVLAHIAQGWPNKIIADRLRITEQTVKLHVGQILRELRVNNRTQAVLKAQKLQMVQVDGAAAAAIPENPY